jgi:hypothetical protein
VAAVKSGTISLNAAAAVASLPAEEQVAAAAAGKDELKEAARRARGSKPKRKQADGAPADAEDSDIPPSAATMGDDDTVEGLRLRVAALNAENTALREKVARLAVALRLAREAGG